MGLTIHYSLTTDLTKPNDVRQVVEAVRQFALDLPFESVGDIIEFTGDDTEPEDDTARWLRIQSESHVEVGQYHYRVPPKHCIAFSTWPGQGCEAANFGSASIPPSSTSRASGSPRNGLDGRGVRSARRNMPAIRNLAGCNISCGATWESSEFSTSSRPQSWSRSRSAMRAAIGSSGT